MRFKDYFETMTSTADVACFARPVLVSVKKKKKKLDEVSWLQNQLPTTKDYVKTVATGALKAGAGAIPFAGAIPEIAEVVYKLFQMRQQGKDVTQLVSQMLDAKDKSPGVPANIFDMDDRLSSTISPQAKMAIAKNIVQKMDGIIQQVQSGQIPQENANTIAIEYLNNIMQQVNAQKV